jgi:hypothetical protein
LGHHDGGAAGRLDAVLFLEIVLQFDGLRDRQAGDLVAEFGYHGRSLS